MDEELKKIQEKLLSADTSETTDVVTKNGVKLIYISWADAWRTVLKICPDAQYEVVTFNGLPYLKTEEGYMVETRVTIANMTRAMWLPVMDTHNKAMRGEPYECRTKNGSFTVESASMTDINKSIMRCLVKNIAMFGYGLNIYQGDEKPDVDEVEYIRPQVRCENCGNIITDYKKKNGDVVRAEAIIENSKAMYHKPLCVHCLSAKNKQEDAQQAQQNKQEDKTEQ